MQQRAFEFGGMKVLVIAPHPDDEVFGCGGFIHRLKAAGSQVYVLYMTVGTTRDFSAAGVSTKEERIAEIEKVAAYLRLDDYGFAFPGDRHHLRLDTLPQRDLIDAIESAGPLSLQELRPDMVLTPPLSDYNQDHRVVSAATMAATRPAAPEHKSFQPLVLTYELPYHQWNLADASPKPNLFVSLPAEALAAKVMALELYRSQLKSEKAPISVRGARVLAAYRGLQCGADAAEGFHVRRLCA